MKFEKKHALPLLVLCLMAGFIASAAIFIASHKATTPVNIFEQTKNECPNLIWLGNIDSTTLTEPVSVSGELSFAGERVPLEDPDVLERLERELQINTYWHSNTLLAMKLANRYFPEIEKILADSGVPADFKYLPLIESGFRNDVSPAGAVGFWQFVSGTAKRYNLEINSEVDERYNIEKSTRAACAFLKRSKEQLGSWTLAAASYNLGLGGMQQRVRDQQTANFYDMYFNPETSRYIFRMLAMKIIFSNPQRAGFKISAEDLYQPYAYTTVVVDTPIASIAGFAARYGLKYKHIKIVNTWLRDAQLTNRERKKYEIKILPPQ